MVYFIGGITTNGGLCGLIMENEAAADSCVLLACQIAVPSIHDRKDQLRHIDNMIEKIAGCLDRRPADLVILPELCTVEYSRESFQRLGELAETLEGEGVSKIKALSMACQTTIVFGMPRYVDGHYRISQVVTGTNGQLAGCYDKLHICQYGASMEKEFFQRGDSLNVFSVAGFRFAPIICYDIRIPELSRTLALEHKVDCLLHCGAYFRDESFASWHAFAMTRAMENQLFLLSLNRAGTDYGQSVFCEPWMDESRPALTFAATEEDFRYIEMNRSRIMQARQRYTFLQDRIGYYDALPVE